MFEFLYLLIMLVAIRFTCLVMTVMVVSVRYTRLLSLNAFVVFLRNLGTGHHAGVVLAGRRVTLVFVMLLVMAVMPTMAILSLLLFRSAPMVRAKISLPFLLVASFYHCVVVRCMLCYLLVVRLKSANAVRMRTRALP